MKAVRHLCLRGNALYICIPKAMAKALNWSPASVLTVEAIGSSAVRVRPFDATDSETAQIPPMNFGIPRTAAK